MTTFDPAAPPRPQTPSRHSGAAHHTTIELIANALATGLHHPGDLLNGQPEQTIHLPMFRTAGMPPQMADAVKQSTRHVAEAITALIETNHTIIDTQELETLRTQANPQNRT